MAGATGGLTSRARSARRCSTTRRHPRQRPAPIRPGARRPVIDVRPLGVTQPGKSRHGGRVRVAQELVGAPLQLHRPDLLRPSRNEGCSIDPRVPQAEVVNGCLVLDLDPIGAGPDAPQLATDCVLHVDLESGPVDLTLSAKLAMVGTPPALVATQRLASSNMGTTIEGLHLASPGFFGLRTGGGWREL